MRSAEEKDVRCCGGQQLVDAPLKSACFLVSDGKLSNIRSYRQQKNINNLFPNAAVFPLIVVFCSYLTLELHIRCWNELMS